MDHCSDNGTRKRNGLIFILGPGGQAAVVTKQMSGGQPDVPQVPKAQNSPSAIAVPLSSSTPSSVVSATVTEASGTFFGTSASPPEPSANASKDAAISSGVATTPSAIPSTVSSGAVYMKTPVFVGIVLGTIAGIACLTALVAWWIRLRSHAKRRRLYDDTDIPWAPSESIDGGLADMTQARSNLESIAFDSQEDSTQAETWQPRGDRDAGEPRRLECYPNPFIFISPSRLGNDQYSQPNSFLPSVGPLRNGPYPTLPSYPRNNINSSSSGSIDDQFTAPSFGPLRVANLLPGDRSAATSRAGTVLDLSYSLGTEDLLNAEANFSKSTLDQRTNSTFSWTDTAPEPSAAPPTSEGWGNSLKSMFTVMASSLSMRGESIREKNDTLSPAPRKRSAYRSGAFTDETSEDGNITERQVTPSDRRSSQSRQLRRDLLSRRGQQAGSPDTPSRASSVYSTSSTVSSANCQFDDIPSATLSRACTSNNSINSQGSIAQRDHARPPALTRVSSTGCSVASQLTDKEEAAQRALIDRRRRVKRQDVEGCGKLGRDIDTV